MSSWKHRVVTAILYLLVWVETCEPNPCVEPAPGPTVIVPTMNQWGIIFASIFLGVIGIVAIIREKNMGRYFDK